MYKIQVFNTVAKNGLAVLPNDYQVFLESQVVSEPQAILLRSYSLHDYPLNKELLAIARAGAGTNNIPIEEATSQGIVVFNTPGANANGVKELVIAGLLLASRDLNQGINWAKGLKGTAEIVKQVEKGKKQFAGPELSGKTLGVIGLGAIGRLVANAADGLGMRVLGYDPFISIESAWGLNRTVQRADSLENLLASADYLTLHIPLTDKTKSYLNQQTIGLMKTGSRLLNFGRGQLVDDEAVLEGLAKGKLSCYVTDFPNELLLSNDKVIPIPHLGASTPESEINCAVMAAQKLVDYLERGAIRHSVNYPDCDLGALSSPARLVVLHRNVPNMVGQITTVLARQEVNISDMVNKSRGAWAVTVLDIDSKIEQTVKDQLVAINDVVKVRLLN